MTQRHKIVAGTRFNRWLTTSDESNLRVWCVCDCGTRRSISVYNLLNRPAKYRSCGCIRKEAAAIKSQYPAEYAVWCSMLYRCKRGDEKLRRSYVDRGVTVCERWRSFRAFIEDMGPRPSKWHSIDRINNDGNYEPNNCRWADYYTQNRNSRGARKLTVGGVTRCLSEWGQLSGIRHQTISYRLKHGWTPEDAVSRPTKRTTA